jgi:hypothetical protein
MTGGRSRRDLLKLGGMLAGGTALAPIVGARTSWSVI